MALTKSFGIVQKQKYRGSEKIWHFLTESDIFAFTNFHWFISVRKSGSSEKIGDFRKLKVAIWPSKTTSGLFFTLNMALCLLNLAQ